jgi:hypothetical protein
MKVVKTILGILVLAAGCGDGENGTQDADVDLSPDVPGEETADPGQDTELPPDAQDATDATDAANIACDFGATFVKQFDKSCGAPGDCAIVIFMADCCQTVLAAGVSQDEKDRFDAAWTACLEELDLCRCPAGPPQAEDGSTARSLEEILVDCKEGSCETYVP